MTRRCTACPCPTPGWVEQMQSCAPSLAQALLPYPQYCGNLQGDEREPGHVHLPLAPGQGREAVLRGHVLPRLVHALEDLDERHRQHPDGRRHLERRERRHLALRAGPQPVPGHERRDPRPLGGARLGAPRRQGQEVRGQGGRRPTRSSAAGSSPRSSATRRGMPVLLPVQLLQRARAVPGGLHPHEHAATSSRRTRGASTPPRGRSSTRARSSPPTTSTSTTGPAPG